MDTFNYGNLIALNVLVIVLVAFFAGCYGRDRFIGAFIATLWGAGAATSLSLFGWIIFVVAHFLGKYW